MDTNSADFQDVLSKRKVHAATLAAGYTRTKRMQEIICILIFVVTLTYNAYRLISFMVFDVLLSQRLTTKAVVETYFVSLVYFIAAVVTMDFISGVMHWGFDTWGTVETPVFGSFIRSFREHHVAPTAMANHDVIETNGDNCLACLVASIPLCFFSVANVAVVGSGNSTLSLEGFSQPWHPFLPASTVMYSDQGVKCYWFAYIIGLLVFGALTNQIHKWTHTAKPPGWVSFLQSVQIVMCKRVHNIHHSVPFDKYYCITTGWLNPVLEVIHFWRLAEGCIQALTGAIPRADDKKRTM